MRDLRERFLDSIRDHEASGEPPDAERVWDAVSGALPPEARREVVDRVAQDPAWAEAWHLASEIWSSTEEGRATLDRPSSDSGFWQHHRMLAAAASIALVVGAGLLVREVLAPEAPFRSPGGAAIESLVPESAALPRDDVVLAWSPLGPDARYRVTVTTESLDPVASAEALEEPRYRVPEEALSEVAPGERLFWRVSARSPDGGEVHSPTFIVIVQ